MTLQIPTYAQPLVDGMLMARPWYTQMGELFKTVQGQTSAADTVSVKAFKATGDGVTDDTAFILNAFAYCIANSVTCYFPAGRYVTSQELHWNDNAPRILGAGVHLSVIVPQATTYHTLRIGTGTETLPNDGFVMHLGFIGPTANPTKTNTAALVLDACHDVTIDSIFVQNHDIGLFFDHNCYGCATKNFRTHIDYSVNLGMYLGDGNTVSGSDLTFDDCKFAGNTAAVMFGGNNGGFGCSNNQFSAGKAGATPDAVLVFGKNYFTGTTGTTTGARFLNCYCEGWKKSYAIKCYGPTRAYFQMSFNCTASGSDTATGILSMASAGDSQIMFSHCQASGSLTAASPLAIAGQSDAMVMWEEAWNAINLTINSVTNQTIYSLGIYAQNGIPSCAPFRSGADSGNTWWQAGPRLFRTTGSAFEYSTNWGSTWAAV